jgi:hypothetical protein
MNHSMYSADRSTHLKIVVAALVAGIVVMGIAMSSHLGSNAGTMAVLKAGKPVVLTSADVTLTR